MPLNLIAMLSKTIHLNIKRTLKVLLLGWFAISPVTSVTCYGEDGHVAVEPIFHDCCCADDDDHHTSLPEEQHSDSESDTHEPCQDVPITVITRVDSSKDTQDVLKVPAVVFFTEFGADLSCHHLLSGFSVARAPCSPSHTPLSSIILLL